MIPRYSRATIVGMAGVIVVQGFHEIEHIMQVIQRSLLDNPQGAGVLGSWLDVEPVHVGYNAAFLLLIGLIYWQGLFWRERRVQPLAFWLMTFALLFQSYHFVEHIFKIAQFIETGRNGTPGILGSHFNVVWLHFGFNTIVYSVMVAAFFAGGFPKAVAEWLRPQRRPVTA